SRGPGRSPPPSARGQRASGADGRRGAAPPARSLFVRALLEKHAVAHQRRRRRRRRTCVEKGSRPLRMPSRILHVVPSLAPRYGGPSAATLGICRALAAAGTRTLIATTDADGPGRLPASLGDVTTYEGLDTVFFPRQISESFKWSSPLARWVRHHATAFDLVHVHAVFSHS